MLIRVEAVPGGFVTVTEDGEEASRLIQQGEAVIGILSEKDADSPQPAGCWSGVSYFITDMEALEDTFYLKEAYFRFHGLPLIIAREEGVCLREMTVADAAGIWKLHQDTQISRFLPIPATSVAELEEKIASYIQSIYAYYSCGIWVLEEEETGEIIGRVGIEPQEAVEEHSEDSSEKPDIEDHRAGFYLGYMLRQDWRGQHLMERMCCLVLADALDRLELEQVYCKIAPENTASLGLARKLGFVHVAGELYQVSLSK